MVMVNAGYLCDVFSSFVHIPLKCTIKIFLVLPLYCHFNGSEKAQVIRRGTECRADIAAAAAAAVAAAAAAAAFATAAAKLIIELTSHW